MYSWLCPTKFYVPPVPRSNKATLPSKPGEPLRIRIPRYIICKNCDTLKIICKGDSTPPAWTCKKCFDNYSF